MGAELNRHGAYKGVRMIWPWSEIEKWKRLAVRNEELLLRAQALGETHRAEYLKLAAAMRGAHKGIWRLKQKLKRYEKEQG